MACTVSKSWAESPYTKGLGINTPLGTGFLRRVSVVFDSGTTSGSILAADLGATAILEVLSVIMKSTNSVYVGSVTNSSIPLTASGNCTCEVLALVRGL